MRWGICCSFKTILGKTPSHYGLKFRLPCCHGNGALPKIFSWLILKIAIEVSVTEKKSIAISAVIFSLTAAAETALEADMNIRAEKLERLAEEYKIDDEINVKEIKERIRNMFIDNKNE